MSVEWIVKEFVRKPLIGNPHGWLRKIQMDDVRQEIVRTGSDWKNAEEEKWKNGDKWRMFMKSQHEK